MFEFNELGDTARQSSSLAKPDFLQENSQQSSFNVGTPITDELFNRSKIDNTDYNTKLDYSSIFPRILPPPKFGGGPTLTSLPDVRIPPTPPQKKPLLDRLAAKAPFVPNSVPSSPDDPQARPALQGGDTHTGYVQDPSAKTFSNSSGSFSAPIIPLDISKIPLLF